MRPESSNERSAIFIQGKLDIKLRYQMWSKFKKQIKTVKNKTNKMKT